MADRKVKNDIILLAVILLSALAVFMIFTLGLKEGKVVKISVDGKELYSLDIGENAVKPVKTEQGQNVIEIKDGSVSVTEADCPDKICVHHRSVSKTGETIVCLPHKLVVEISGEKD